jgi:hypothetical protein
MGCDRHFARRRNRSGVSAGISLPNRPGSVAGDDGKAGRRLGYPPFDGSIHENPQAAEARREFSGITGIIGVALRRCPNAIGRSGDSFEQ